MRTKRFLSTFLCAVLILTLLPSTTRAENDIWDGTMSQPVGEGTSTSHYLIYTAKELAWFANKVNSGDDQTLYADLMADIVLNDTTNWTEWATEKPDNTWTPISNIVNQNRIIFDGGGHTISGLYIKSSDNYVGLFGYIGKNSSGFESAVKNLNLIESYIKGGQYVGGICRYLHQSSSISGCSSSAAVTGTGQYVGGIAGYVFNMAKVTDCQNMGTVSGNQNVGGITGWSNGNSSITGCKNEGEINATSSYAGGIAGGNAGIIANAYNTAAVSSNRNVGGICSYNGGTVSNVYNTGVISGTEYTGKVCGYNITGSSINSAWFLGTSTDKGIGLNLGSAAVYYASAGQFASGETAYLLGSGFGQRLGIDSSPVFRSSDGSNTVYKLSYMVNSTEYAVPYYNSGDTVSTARYPGSYHRGRLFRFMVRPACHYARKRSYSDSKLYGRCITGSKDHHRYPAYGL